MDQQEEMCNTSSTVMVHRALEHCCPSAKLEGFGFNRLVKGHKVTFTNCTLELNFCSTLWVETHATCVIGPMPFQLCFDAKKGREMVARESLSGKLSSKKA